MNDIDLKQIEDRAVGELAATFKLEEAILRHKQIEFLAWELAKDPAGTDAVEYLFEMVNRKRGLMGLDQYSRNLFNF